MSYKAITDKYKDITPYHSGGGCNHLRLESSVLDDQGRSAEWLINAIYEDETGVMEDIDFDINNITETSNCMFGLHIQDGNLNQAQEEVLSSVASDVLMSDSDNFVFIESFKDGYEMMKDIDNRLTNAPTWGDC
jgi:hypothetical protein